MGVNEEDDGVNRTDMSGARASRDDAASGTRHVLDVPRWAGLALVDM